MAEKKKAVLPQIIVPFFLYLIIVFTNRSSFIPVSKHGFCICQ